jgi:hypothetical protein
MSAARHLQRIFERCERGVVEFRAIPSGQKAWAELRRWSHVGAFVTQAVRTRKAALVGLATRRDATSGAESNLLELAALFADIETPPDVTRTRLRAFPFRPSLFIGSGLGSHLGWQLKEALDLSNANELARAASLMRRLSGYLGGDPRATSPAIAPRLAGSFNFKYAEPRPVMLIDESDHEVNAREFEGFLPAEVARRGQHVLTASIPVGSRNDTLYIVIRSLRSHGVPFAAIVDRVHTLNQTQCETPLPDAEITQLLRYALKQPDRPDFRGPLSAPVVVHEARRPLRPP